ncbi:uncharacterized protein N7459_008474 [Penicillium hispanicum]|uniref:uncharacterized protein n=1 Tax=Penicillium hispanicum TaxID=1080232 RepID=UPI00254115B1|nr:uncharacterized protein N7459_008474 [Penicillium hispanicum]KAJ5574047.1 hypothetical protein N7459_008474 [Penicillium hispanicum]
MDPAEFAPFQNKLSSTLIQVTRTVNQLSSEDLNFHRTSSAELTKSLDEQSERVLALTSAALKAATAGTDIAAPELRDEESVEDNWHGVVDVIDSLLEKADACLDEFTGVIKKLSPSQEEQASTVKKTPNFPTIYDYGPSKIPKPQLQFERKPDNSDLGLFKPLLRTKPHAIVALKKSLKEKQIDGKVGYPSPYEKEISDARYPKSAYQKSAPIDYLPFESTTATFVDTLDGVKEMLAELKTAKEIAIDLEHHDVHSYQGLVSLMQISTRDKDWVVDTLKPWREELQILNEVFADPKILKVLHGSTMDIIWLQRDLGLYVVGMFDTFHAASALGYPKRSLKFLLNKFVNFEADKRYQMADWRIRPLPTGMFNYARSDTHYLLYVYDHLRNELIEASEPNNSLIDYVQERSKNEALQRYERPVYDATNGQGPGGWYDLLSRSSGMLSKEQFAVFKAVHKWRDEVAREEDEGWQCVFPRHILFKLAQAMPLDMGTLLRTLSPVTPITKARAADLLATIKEAKIAGATGPEWRDVVVPKPVAKLETLGIERVDFPVAERYETSQFWGDVWQVKEQSAPLSYSLVASTEALRLSLPLPPMPSTVSQARETLGTADKQPATAAPQTASVPAPAPDAQDETKNIFTVKELGGPRKRKATPVDTPEQELSTPDELDVTSNDPDSSEKQRKKSRKEKKSKKAKNTKPQNEADVIPFDYGTADSVLHAPSTSGPATQPKKAFNPYAKALEAPSGVRKQKRDTAGKSLTFRK